MKIEDKKLFISEYSQLIQDKEYKELMERYKKEMMKLRKQVFLDYTSGRLKENQLYNEKNKAVEVLWVLLEAKDDFEKIQLPWVKYMITELDDRIQDHTNMIETSIGWLQTWLTMSVYTESDLDLQKALALEHIITAYDKALEDCKKDTESDKTLDTVVEEDNS